LAGASRIGAQPRHLASIPENALVDAVKKGDQARVIALLNQGAKINAEWLNQTPLTAAVFEQDVEMVKLLLDRSAKIEAEDLAEAADNGTNGDEGDQGKALTIITLLIAKGANVREQGAEALVEAARVKKLEVFRLLLAKGANANGKTEADQSVLMRVVKNDYLDCGL
jgi:ankyrin repeat protein